MKFEQQNYLIWKHVDQLPILPSKLITSFNFLSVLSAWYISIFENLAHTDMWIM